MDNVSAHRPRNVGWARAAGLLYGDWGTSKAYVIGLGFAAAGYTSLPLILAVCALTAVVGFNYSVICKHFPDGGGVYSAARLQSRFLAATGALLLIANFTVTAAMSGWTAMHYFGVPLRWIPSATMAVILVIGAINYFGPKHSGSLAIAMAIPMAIVVFIIILLSVPHLTLANLEPSLEPFSDRWIKFTGVILALSGVEAVANLTGVMKLDPGSSMDEPHVGRTARRAILPVAAEVVLGTSLLAWAMLSVAPSLKPVMNERWEDMLRFLGEHYAALALGPELGRAFGLIVGVIVGVLLLSAVNTAVAALIGLQYMMARDGEMPRAFKRLNPHGVPRVPLAIAVAMPLLVAAVARDLEMLAGLYAIGVVGAIAVNLGSCGFNRLLKLHWAERGVMLISFAVLAVVELTVARQKHDALFFALCVVCAGLALRSYAQRRAGLRTLTVSREVAAAVAPEMLPNFQIQLNGSQTILVAARGLTPVLRYALEEARLRQGSLYVLYVKELAVAFSGRLSTPDRPRWQDDPKAAEIMVAMIELGRQNSVPVVPVYTVSEDPAGTILDASATLGVDMLLLGASHRRSLVNLLKGNVVHEVARHLPENIQLVIHG